MNNDVWMSPFPVVRIEMPTGNPKFGRLTVEIVHHSPHESFIRFQTQNSMWTFLSLTKEHSIFYAEYEGKRYPVFLKAEEVLSIFYLSVLDLFTKISKDWG